MLDKNVKGLIRRLICRATELRDKRRLLMSLSAHIECCDEQIVLLSVDEIQTLNESQAAVHVRQKVLICLLTIWRCRRGISNFWDLLLKLEGGDVRSEALV